MDVSSLPASNTTLGLAVQKAHLGEELTEEERAVFSMWMYSAWVNYQQIFQEYQRLEVDAQVVEAQRVRVVGAMKPRLVRALWERLKDRYTPDFVAFVEENCMPAEEDA